MIQGMHMHMNLWLFFLQEWHHGNFLQKQLFRGEITERGMRTSLQCRRLPLLSQPSRNCRAIMCNANHRIHYKANPTRAWDHFMDELHRSAVL